MRFTRWIGCLAIAAPALLCSAAGAQTVKEEANVGRAIQLPRAVPEIEDAIRRARASLPDFFALARSPKPEMDAFAVLVGLRDGNNNTEYRWVGPFERSGGKYSGRLNDTPPGDMNILPDYTVTFDEDQIVDWMFLEAGRIKGHFTTCVLLRREMKERAEGSISRSRIDCGF
jgi:uncharacterized protein YegJ (DUF2314 family)